MQDIGSKKYFKILKYFTRDYYKNYIGLTLLGIIVGLLEAGNLAVFIPMIDELLGVEKISDNLQGSGLGLLNWLKSLIVNIPVKDPFLAACGLFLVLTFLKCVLSVLFEYFVACTSGTILHEFRMKLIERFRLAPIAYLAEQKLGGLVYNLMTPPILLCQMLYGAPRFLIDGFRFLSVFILLVYVEPKISLGIFIFGFIVYMLFSRRVSGYTYYLAGNRRRGEENIGSCASEWLRGFRPIRLASADLHWFKSLEDSSLDSKKSYIHSQAILASPRHVFELFAFGLLLVGLMISYIWAPDSFLKHVATIGFFSMGLVRVLPSIASVARIPLDIRTTLPDVEYLYKLLNESVPEDITGSIDFDTFKTSLELQDVVVTYPGRGNVLKNINLSIPKGKVIALVGPSGSGKTTLVNLLLGIVQPDSGKIILDGKEYPSFNKQSLLAKIGYVGQDILVFNGTIKDNITFFKSGISHELVIQAAKDAYIHDFIMSIPEGYNSWIGENGVNLSGGQKQRLAVARALIHQPEILILDEATSALDSDSEKVVMSALQRAAINRTVILVTHRLLSIKWVDYIYVFKDGKIEEQGSWHKLKELLSVRV